MEKVLYLITFCFLMMQSSVHAEQIVVSDFETIGKGSLSPPYDYAEKQRIIEIYNQKELEVFWGKYFDDPVSGYEIPNIDFNNYFLVAAVDSIRSSGGFSIEIKSIEFYDNSQRYPSGFKVELNQPGSRVGTIAVMSQPYHLIRVRKMINL